MCYPPPWSVRIGKNCARGQSLAGFEWKFVALLKLSNWIIYLDRRAVISQEICRSKGDVKGRTYRFFEQTHPTPFFYRWVKVLVTPFRVMIHSPVKLSSVASQIHSIFPQVNNYGRGTRRILMIKVNLIMVEPRSLMFLSSICGHNAEHLLLLFCFYLRLSICVRLHFKVKITR